MRRLRSTASSTRRSRSRISRASRASVRLYSTKRSPVLLEEAQDLLGPAVAGERLAFAQHRARHRVEAVVVHPDEGAAQELDPVEHDAAGDRSPAASPARRPRARRRRAPGPRPSSSGTPCRSARRASTDRSKSTTFQPVSTSGSSSRTRARTPRAGPSRTGRGAPRPDSSSPGASAGAPPRRRSREGRPRAGGGPRDRSRCRARGRESRGVQSAGRISGSSKTRPTPGTSRPSPRISREPRIPRSIRYRMAKRTSAS